MEALARDMERMMLDFPEEMEKMMFDLPEDMEIMLQPPARDYVKNNRAMLRTPADVFEYPDFYSFHIDMPGLDVDNIKVKVEDGVLNVLGKKQKKAATGEEGEKESGKVIRLERRRARYLRKFSLPRDANPDEVKASYKDGVLTVIVKRKAAEDPSKPKTITVAVS